MRKDIQSLIGDFYREPLRRSGATPQGVSWPNAGDLATRFEVLMSGADLETRSEARKLRLLDLGCGPGLLLDWLAANNLLHAIEYVGVDVTEDTMAYARERWPSHRFELRDVRDQPFEPGTFDYCIACGVFMARWPLSHDEMRNLICETLCAIWPSANIGLAFNVMSKHVDWERDDLFHWALDDMMAFCKSMLSRHVSLRLDYGPWEAAAIVTRQPLSRTTTVPSSWNVDSL